MLAFGLLGRFEFVVKSIVDHPDQVEVTQTVDDLGVLITLKVEKEDMGKIIGKSGRGKRRTSLSTTAGLRVAAGPRLHP